jgi:hypothetical protein
MLRELPTVLIWKSGGKKYCGLMEDKGFWSILGVVVLKVGFKGEGFTKRKI